MSEVYYLKVAVRISKIKKDHTASILLYVKYAAGSKASSNASMFLVVFSSWLFFAIALPVRYDNFPTECGKGSPSNPNQKELEESSFAFVSKLKKPYPISVAAPVAIAFPTEPSLR